MGWSNSSTLVLGDGDISAIMTSGLRRLASSHDLCGLSMLTGRTDVVRDICALTLRRIPLSATMEEGGGVGSSDWPTGTDTSLLKDSVSWWTEEDSSFVLFSLKMV